MGNCGGKDGRPGCKQRWKDYYSDKRLAYQIYIEAKNSPTVTQNVQRPDMLLKSMKR